MLEAPPDSVGVVDTMGCILPEAMKYMVRLVKSLPIFPWKCHTHNDFGMAVATELAGVEAGANCVHSCANGLGERTGNALLEELMVALHVLTATKRNTSSISCPNWARWSAGSASFRSPVNKPILGDRNFTRESGIGVDLVVKEPLAMFGTHPALTAPQRRSRPGQEEWQGVDHIHLEQIGINDADR